MWVAVATFFANIWGRIQFYALAAIAVIVALGVAWLKGRSEGKAMIVEEQKQQRAESIVQRKETDEKVDAVPTADLDERIDKWMRD